MPIRYAQKGYPPLLMRVGINTGRSGAALDSQR